jgi:hypothetical protein
MTRLAIALMFAVATANAAHSMRWHDFRMSTNIDDLRGAGPMYYPDADATVVVPALYDPNVIRLWRH